MEWVWNNPFISDFCFRFQLLARRVQLKLKNENITLLPEKALLLKDYQALLIADLHFGKVSHFRKSGIAVPKSVVDGNWNELIGLLSGTEVSRIIFMGDLFHSFHNTEWDEFCQIISSFPEKKFELVEGNHDILSNYQYDKAGIGTFPEIELGNLLLTHEPIGSFSGPLYNIAGHIHPGITLRGKARQKVTLPCFWFGQHQGLIPAFGKFTGLARIKPAKEDIVVAVVERKLVRLDH